MDNLSPGMMGSSSNQKQHLALRVALDTMKDRCILQQKRLSEVEEENQQLLERLTQNTKPANTPQHNAGGVAENFQLRLQVSELQRQNTQLNAHINMVSAENRKLWSRLSQMAKDQNSSSKDSDSTLTNTSGCGAGGDDSPRGLGANGSTNQNLIRSKTFTQHSPNPNLRHKVIPADNCDSTDMLDVSLENDVALEVFGDDANRQQQSGDDVGQVAVGFGFLTVDDSSAANSSQEQDFNAEARKCIEGLQDMRREAMKQQQELNSVFALLESRIALQPCSECVKKSHKPEMADKSLETDESFNDVKYTHNTNDLNNINDPIQINTLPATPTSTIQTTNNHLNIIQEKILADNTNKICPMCGKLYGCQVSFESFREHVEDHFRDDSINIDHSIEHNFELVSHAVGDF